MAHDSRAIANYFLDRAAASRMSLSPLSLLKILYFAHAWHLAKFKEALVGQPFEAWKYGPVVRVVYSQLKQFGDSPVTSKLTKLDIDTGEFVEAKEDLPADKRAFLDNLFDYYSKFHPFTLVDLTHEEDSPWDVVWREAERSAVPGMWISDSLILEWFEKTGGRVYVREEHGAKI